MEDLFKIVLYSSFSGVTVFLGGFLSKLFERYFREGLVKEEIIHTSVAFGAGNSGQVIQGVIQGGNSGDTHAIIGR